MDKNKDRISDSTLELRSNDNADSGSNKQSSLDEIMEKALDCFYGNGYHATTIELLTEKMNVNEDELVRMFGDKQTLFETVLASYSHAVVSTITHQLENSDSPIAGIKAVMEDIIRITGEDADHRGCMVTNTAVEFGAKDKKIAESVNRTFAAIEEAFFIALTRAQLDGELDYSKDPKSLARFLVSTIQGIRVMGRTKTDPVLLNNIYESALNCLN